jgi:DDE superfamily endonuclease
MEDVLDLYEEEYDQQYPTVCLDEKPVVLHADVQPPVPVEPGKSERVDYEYERRGTRNLFVLVEPLAGWRHVEVTAQRTMQDYAKVVRWLVDEVYPQAEIIRLVQDNLNTHTPASLYETFPPAEARRILQRLEFHYIPKHGSWLNMAEIEIAILERNALSRRLESEAALRRQVLAVEMERNTHKRGIAWQFTRARCARQAGAALSRERSGQPPEPVWQFEAHALCGKMSKLGGVFLGPCGMLSQEALFDALCSSMTR